MSLEKEQPRYVKSYAKGFNKNSIFIVVSIVCLLLHLYLYGSPVYVIIKASITETVGKGFQTNAGNSETEMTVIFYYRRFVFKETD